MSNTCEKCGREWTALHNCGRSIRWYCKNCSTPTLVGYDGLCERCYPDAADYLTEGEKEQIRKRKRLEWVTSHD